MRGYSILNCVPENAVYKEVVVVGNGPSGITLSYILSGHWPYYAGHKIPESLKQHNRSVKNLHHQAHPAASSSLPSSQSLSRLNSEDEDDDAQKLPLNHPDEYLTARLRETPARSLLLQDLRFLSQGLEGRSRNPISLLFDALSHPGADLGLELPSMLKWRYHPSRKVDHVVLGKGPPGGSWPSMNSSILTISLGSWMELPGFDYRTWEAEARSNAGGMSPTGPRDVARASAASVALYYQDYIQHMNLEENFQCGTVVTSARPIPYPSACAACCQRQLEMDGEDGCTSEEYWKPLSEEEQQWWLSSSSDDEDKAQTCPETGMSCLSRPTLWRVSGYQVEEKVEDDGRVSEVCHEFSYVTPHLVLATGCSDRPNRLGIPGETLPFVVHSLKDLDQALVALRSGCEGGELSGANVDDPVLIVGAGLSAADAVLGIRFQGMSVLHAFRKPTDPANGSGSSSGILLKQLPGHLYPEYHKVLQMMSEGRNGGSYRGYQALCGGKLVEIRPDHKVCLAFENDEDLSDTREIHRVSLVVILIGSKPDLSFLPHGGRHLATDSYSNTPVSINPYTHQCRSAPGLYALGPLVGDNFVRFLKGGALAVASQIQNELKQSKHSLIRTLPSDSDHS
ncbi:oxidative stress-induced growth inhibitor 1-like [Ischnura elegans]|uniref:oxidative stress-induced growth inhibitor 1-like n=1 Tax=Ischnura elegans TaxID=197161 RepID=UPI001ED8AA5F|nr:oxidative stress-induced growth inhibitor 1-like [Ischnura elegans]XP_046386315.1 oxidative stress-induced growth inhibitor 1-like [Ischnura elegans]XP_046386316.1 oxidative stress-induced growth inhibitor 1-like [Ischnura elegans]XP_046386317.1 oxidative stress-induced growth inhibitor 1-like [Ischnura elegans]XP_046386318.1 oxidative stress-induced growth inhibitor 1-like [Ischnura elegans]XP_046386319.1 oxidative stress-induced growth inhibitor 1-like [Ischnura elegans]